MDELDRRIIQAMQEEFPLSPEPYREIAAKIGISGELLLERLRGYKASGKIRKMGAVLRHREIGYAANVLAVWRCDAARRAAAVAAMVAEKSVSHCYERVTRPEWPYSLYTMIHAHSRAECERLVDELAAKTGLCDCVLLYSVKEWKKTSMRYFAEQG